MEKGKWYKGVENECYYIRYSHTKEKDNYTEYHGETIYPEGIYKKSDWWNNDNFTKYAEEHPVSIEEIRQYLPKDHQDLQDIVIENFQIY